MPALLRLDLHRPRHRLPHRQRVRSFGHHIAKYFGNAVREAVLLQRCDGGIVFLPGAGGTVQEIFQDGCENYYATPEALSPMVLVGRKYWTEELPAWPLLEALARGRDMEDSVHLVDTVDRRPWTSCNHVRSDAL